MQYDEGYLRALFSAAVTLTLSILGRSADTTALKPEQLTCMSYN